MAVDLKGSAVLAVEAIGEGLTHFVRSNPGILDAHPITPEAILNESIAVIFRLLFGFYAQSRHMPGPGIHTSPVRNRPCALILDGRSRLFDPDTHPLLSLLEVPEHSLARASDILSKTEEIDYEKLDVREFGTIYETLLEYSPGNSVPVTEFEMRRRGRDSRRKRSGAYYTPENIVRYIISTTLGPLGGGNCRSAPEPGSGRPLSSDEILDLKVLDPAMGSAHFLIETVEYLARAYGAALAREEKRDSKVVDAMAEWRYLVAERCVYGVDINPMAVEIAELSLQLFAWVPGRPLPFLKSHVKCGDSLCGPGSFDWTSEFPEVAPGETGSARRTPGFDVVIGNPPYVSLSGRQKPRGMYAALEGRQKGNAAARPGRWPSLHGDFMTRSLELAREGGLISMVVPGQVGHLPGYGRLRSRMLESGELLEVRYWGEDIFEGVTTPSLTFMFSKRLSEPGRSALAIDEDGKRTFFRPRGEDEWYSSASRKVCERMQARHPTLKTFSDPGVHTGNVAKRIILKEPGAETVPVLEGRRIHPFCCDSPDRWLDPTYVCREGEYFRMASEEVYRNTDIILRQTADRPIAARHIHQCHFRNSVLALKVEEPFSVEYLLAVLNSDAARWIYAALSYEAKQRAFPQVKIHALRRLPIPDPSAHPNRARADRIIETVCRIESQAVPEDALFDELNRLVRDLYGLGVHSSALGGLPTA
ncbi:MAG: TaqI-like C-terminal specificity domain-containing protein [Candidatus Eisenbacteria bacterium]